MNREAAAGLAWLAKANHGSEAMLKAGTTLIIAASSKWATMTRTTGASTGCNSQL